MRLGNTVEFTHVALGLVPEILDAIDVIVAVCEELRVVDAEVMEVRHIQHIIAAPEVGMNDAIRWLVGECEAITERPAPRNFPHFNVEFTQPLRE